MDAASAVIGAKEALAGLTVRQRQVVLMKAAGMTAAEIGSALVRTEANVKSHLYDAFKRLGIKNSVQLAVLCTLAGEITDWKNAA